VVFGTLVYRHRRSARWYQAGCCRPDDGAHEADRSLPACCSRRCKSMQKSDRCRSVAYRGKRRVEVHFGLTDEQEQLRREVRSFAERELAPHVMEWDEKSEFPHAAVKKLGEMGLMGVIVPEEFGGWGMEYVEYVLAVEELSRVDGSVGIIVASHNSLCTNHLMLGGDDTQRKRWVTKLASGEWLGG